MWGRGERTRGGPWPLLIVLGAVACAIAVWAAQPYPGVTVDSGEYLAVADGLVDGHGYTMPYASYDEAFRVIGPRERVPMTQFPPLYPSAVALFHGIGLSLLAAARAVGAASYAASVIVASFLVWRHTRRLPLPFVAAGLLLAPELLTLHAMAWSEPLMVLATLGALYFTTRYVETGATRDLIGAGVSASLASLARFAGISVIVAVAVAVLLIHEWPLRRRLLRAGVFAAISMVPVALWFVRNAAVSGVASEKEPVWHPPTWTHLRQAFETLGGWVQPWTAIALPVGIMVALVATVAALRLLRPLLRTGASSLPSACLLFALVYLFFLLLSRTVLDQNIPFDARLLSPVQVLVVVGVCSAAAGLEGVGKMSWARYVLVALALLATIRGVVTAAGFSGSSVAAYSGDEWRSSETLAHVGSLDRSTLIITNAPDPIWLWHGRAPLIIPPRSSLYSGQRNENYSAQVHEVLRRTRCEVAVVVFFKQPTRKPPRTIDPLVVDGLRLTEILPFEDGNVFEVDEPTAGCS
ncbi:MAG: glycosyltransferase family 39 protein [Actinomycetota bacterium]